MSPPPVKKLFDLEIDEISVVDRPANQHGLITFAKNTGFGVGQLSQEDQMPEDDGIYDADGLPVDEEVLEHGDVVFDADGNEYVFVEEEEQGEEQYDEVGKAGVPGVGRAWDAARRFGSSTRSGAKIRRMPGAEAGQAWQGVSSHPGMGRAGRAGLRAGLYAPEIAAGGALGLGAAGAGIGYGRTRKSLSAGDVVLEELSKAMNSNERDEIIAKALDEVEVYKAAAIELQDQMDALEDERITEVFISKAAEYNLPVNPDVLGPILKAVAEVLTDEQLDVLDAIFDSVGDALYEEIGYVGDTANHSVLDSVDAYASELVGKADVSHAEAMTALFNENPTAYDAYLAENGR